MFKIYIDPENDTDPSDDRYYRDSSPEVAEIQAQYELRAKLSEKKCSDPKKEKMDPGFKPLFCKDAVTVLHMR